MVSAERIRRARIASSAVRAVSLQFTGVSAPSRVGSSIWPSRIRITRRAATATSCSWVISTMVRPEACSSSNSDEDVGGGVRVEVAGRLVGQDQRRVGHQRPGDRDPLLLTAGHLTRPVLGPVGQPDPGQRLHRPLPALGLVHPGVAQRQLDVAPGRHRGQQVELLEDEPDLLVADLGQLGLAHLRDVGAVQLVVPAGRVVQAAEDVHQRRLARPRRPHDRDVVTRLDVQRDTPQRVHLTRVGAVDLRDVLHRQDRRPGQDGLGRLGCGAARALARSPVASAAAPPPAGPVPAPPVPPPKPPPPAPATAASHRHRNRRHRTLRRCACRCRSSSRCRSCG